MKTHELKIHPSFFEQVANGNKPFEIRKNDRDFKLHDVLLLREIEPTRSVHEPTKYTGRMKAAKVTYITDFEQKPDYVVMGISLI
jgi:hypothetical protein